MCILCFIANAMYHMLYSIPFFLQQLESLPWRANDGYITFENLNVIYHLSWGSGSCSLSSQAPESGPTLLVLQVGPGSESDRPPGPTVERTIIRIECSADTCLCGNFNFCGGFPPAPFPSSSYSVTPDFADGLEQSCCQRSASTWALRLSGRLARAPGRGGGCWDHHDDGDGPGLGSRGMITSPVWSQSWVRPPVFLLWIFGMVFFLFYRQIS